MIKEIYKRLKWFNETDRLGPDILSTHWQLYFKSSMLKLCKKKFYYFDDEAEFRPGGLAVGCSRISIGKRTVIRPGTQLYGFYHNSSGITIMMEDYVMIGAGVHIYVSNHRFSDINELIINQGNDELEPVHLKKGCWIGAKSIILPGVTLGEHSVVAAGSVVSGEIPPYSIVAGNPARVVRKQK